MLVLPTPPALLLMYLQSVLAGAPPGKQGGGPVPRGVPHSPVCLVGQLPRAGGQHMPHPGPGSCQPTCKLSDCWFTCENRMQCASVKLHVFPRGVRWVWPWTWVLSPMLPAGACCTPRACRPANGGPEEAGGHHWKRGKPTR